MFEAQAMKFSNARLRSLDFLETIIPLEILDQGSIRIRAFFFFFFLIALAALNRIDWIGGKTGERHQLRTDRDCAGEE